jgi:hypothetical protein
MKIAILTNHMEMIPGFSLTGIIQDQCRMLSRFGHDVHLFVNEQFNENSYPVGLDGLNVTIEKKVPFAHLVDYQSQKDLNDDHVKTVTATAEMLEKELADFDFAFTHDWIFQGWFLPYGLGCVKASLRLKNCHFLHWIHSVPSGFRDWWQIRHYGSNHTLVYPNETDRLYVAEQYRGAIDNVRTIHHIKDLRTWFDFDPITCDIINRVPSLMQADVVQILPASADRLSAKRVKETILIFSKLKEQGERICLFVANQWATTRTHKESVQMYKKIAADRGLTRDELVFSSEMDETYEIGLPKRVIRELFQLSNLFIFLTREESFGLVIPEACLSGGVLLVNNQSLDMQREIAKGTGLYFDFESNRRNLDHVKDEDNYFNGIATIIRGRMRQDDAIKSKTAMRQAYNMDYLYNHEYAPIMAELKGRLKAEGC